MAGWGRGLWAFATGAVGMLLLAVGTASVGGGNVRAEGDCQVASSSNDAQEMALLTLINSHRQQNGLGSLAFNATLNKTATWMVEDMAANGTFSHTDSLGRSAFARAVDCGFPGGAGENLAGGQDWDTASEVFEAWKGSPGHNNNMLGEYYGVIGVARLEAPGSPYGWYWAAEFGVGSNGGGAEATATPTPTKTPTPATATATKTPTPAGTTPTMTPTPAPPSATPTKTPAPSTPAAATKTPTPQGASPSATKTPAKAASWPTATPTRTPVPPAGATSLALRPGANLVAWPGMDTPSAQALKSSGAVISIVYRWDAATRTWQRYAPGVPAFVNTLSTMRRGEAYWVIAKGQSHMLVP